MCAPAAIGAVSAISGIAGSVGQYQSGQAAAGAQNAATLRQYRELKKQRKTSWQRESLRYGYQKLQFEQQVDENYTAAGNAYAASQRKLNEQFKEASFNSQARMIELMSKQGIAAAQGKTGRSFDRIDDSMLAAFGRNQAIQAASLLSARDAMNTNNKLTRDALISDNRKAFSPVAMQPVPGVAPAPPTMVSGPSGLGLAAGLLGAGVQGYQTYQSLKAPTTGLPSMNYGPPLNG